MTTVRRRHFSYRTEQSYLVWLEKELTWDPRGGMQRRHHVSDQVQRGACDRSGQKGVMLAPKEARQTVALRLTMPSKP